MKLQIVGLGIVGTAQAYLSKKLGHDVIGYDLMVKSHPYCDVNNGVRDADITFTCESFDEELKKKLVKR